MPLITGTDFDNLLSAGDVAQVLVEQQGHTSRCPITSGVIGGISIT